MEDGAWHLGWKLPGPEKAVDKRITISRIAVPLKMCTAMAAEVAGARVLTGILDLVLGKISV